MYNSCLPNSQRHKTPCNVDWLYSASRYSMQSLVCVMWSHSIQTVHKYRNISSLRTGTCVQTSCNVGHSRIAFFKQLGFSVQKIRLSHSMSNCPISQCNWYRALAIRNWPPTSVGWYFNHLWLNIKLPLVQLHWLDPVLVLYSNSVLLCRIGWWMCRLQLQEEYRRMLTTCRVWHDNRNKIHC